ncbi:YicC/YloC family endoribonuclease [Basilea psittacipulmonis]|uniref:YicC family protein n=1 Tax=Basilea psittacipulmonis DSM 24701 TaxID=1072685 RepID=A0A077DGK1_9BURK|nr:YicC/YloC family endoribonuclease [Basilea psittacipulmonis]AIL32607.1 hypothetical protein IX83_04155 [Basilea psittacipulmonis DSM 24701]
MIHSMTAFANGTAQSNFGTLNIDLRSVNSRYLDLNIRLPEELNGLEAMIREKIASHLKRGKVEIKLNYQRRIDAVSYQLKDETLALFQALYQQALNKIPNTAPPSLNEMLNWQTQQKLPSETDEQWIALFNEAFEHAIQNFNANRLREGQRLATALFDYLEQMSQIITFLKSQLPDLLAQQKERMTQRLTETLNSVIALENLSQISGQELSLRINQEINIFSIRNDVAEEITRLESHIIEAKNILKNGSDSSGKRLDFLCQEMNRESNTLGSKSFSLEQTKASMDLKLFIDKIREQVQNIE